MNFHRTLFLVPFVLEAKAILQAFAWKSKEGYWELSTDKGDWFLVICGQGKAQCAVESTYWAHKLGAQRMVLLGTAGALDQNLRLQEIWVSERLVESDFYSWGKNMPASKFPQFKAELESFEDLLKVESSEGLEIKRGIGLSQDQTVSEITERRELAQKFTAQYVSWEGAGLAKAARRLNLPWAEVRIISDVDGIEDPQFFKEQVKECSQKLAIWLKEVVYVH